MIFLYIWFCKTSQLKLWNAWITESEGEHGRLNVLVWVIIILPQAHSQVPFWSSANKSYLFISLSAKHLLWLQWLPFDFFNWLINLFSDWFPDSFPDWLTDSVTSCLKLGCMICLLWYEGCFKMLKVTFMHPGQYFSMLHVQVWNID